MNQRRIISKLVVAAALVNGLGEVCSQQSLNQRFIAHNSEMGTLQPAWIVPLVTPDPRLIQYARASVSHEYTEARTETVNYGNGRGFGLISGNRFEFDYVPPAYIQHNAAGSIDGFGDTSTLVKYRLASGNARHGNFDVAAMLSHSFATGTYKNGALTDSFAPTVAGGYAYRRFDAISSLGATMPTGKIATQGRCIAWNAVGQFHVSSHTWLELENNATFYFSGSHDGKMQNFVTPAAFYVLRRKEWNPTHPFLIFDAGMQIATSGFHTYNHNLISETRILF
ncbi:MAG: hypothetical protein WA802_06550 [Terracidiphilus sp.]